MICFYENSMPSGLVQEIGCAFPCMQSVVQPAYRQAGTNKSKKGRLID
jgi:hypothetical protein